MLKLALVAVAFTLAQDGDFPEAPAKSGGPARTQESLKFTGEAPLEESPPEPQSYSIPKEDGGSVTVSMDDARMNFASVVETFIGQRSPDGFWPLKDKATGRKRQLKLESIDEKKIAPAQGGSARFTGPAILTDLADGGKQLQAWFTVDLGGSQWKVVGMKLSQPAASPERRASARTKAPPGKPKPAE